MSASVEVSAATNGCVLGDGLGRRSGDHRCIIVDVGQVDRDRLRCGVDPIKGRNLDLIAMRIGLVVRGRLNTKLLSATSNNAASAPPVIENFAGLIPTVSTSVEVNAATNLVFSATVCVPAVVMTGALSFISATLPGVNSHEVTHHIVAGTYAVTVC